MPILESREKYFVLSKLLTTKDESISFNENTYNTIFRDINLIALENFLLDLSKKGVISFEIYAEDGYAAEFSISNIDHDSIKDEMSLIKTRHRKFVNRSFSVIAMCLMMVVVILMTIYSFYFSPHSSIKEYVALLMSLLLTTMTFYISSTVKREKADREIDRYAEKLKRTIIEPSYVTYSSKKEAVPSKEHDENDALKLMLVNMEEIKAYYTLSKTQAKESFRLSVWMCILGFILLVAAVVLPFLTSGKYEVSIITAIGGAIVEIIAGTSLFVYKNSLTQLNHYYESLHDNERFLSTVNLVRKLSPEKQDDMYIEIIRSGIKNMDSSQTTKEQ